MDYMASLHELNRCAHGYGAHFTLGLLDRFWKPEMTEEEGIEVIRKCIEEIKTRFLVNRSHYTVKLVNSKGVKVIHM